MKLYIIALQNRQRLVVVGDFKAKIKSGAWLTSSKGEQLHQAIKEIKFEFISTGIIRLIATNKIPDLIDFFPYLKTYEVIFFILTSSMNSIFNHTTILLSLIKYIVKQGDSSFLIGKLKNWEYFKTSCERAIILDIPVKTEE